MEYIDSTGKRHSALSNSKSPPRAGRVDGPAEIGDLQLPVDANQDVLRFDVPIDHVLRVAILQGVRHLEHVLQEGGDG